MRYLKSYKVVYKIVSFRFTETKKMVPWNDTGLILENFINTPEGHR